MSHKFLPHFTKRATALKSEIAEEAWDTKKDEGKWVSREESISRFIYHTRVSRPSRSLEKDIRCRRDDVSSRLVFAFVLHVKVEEDSSKGWPKGAVGIIWKKKKEYERWRKYLFEVVYVCICERPVFLAYL